MDLTGKPASGNCCLLHFRPDIWQRNDKMAAVALYFFYLNVSLLTQYDNIEIKMFKDMRLLLYKCYLRYKEKRYAEFKAKVHLQNLSD